MLTYRTKAEEVRESLGVGASRIKSGNDRLATKEVESDGGDKGNTEQRDDVDLSYEGGGSSRVAGSRS
ncbi:hypothetical protein SAMN05216243_2608 [Sediminibacillus albus]|uniref:Uncharacterized protein n=2 Tax=Sediminibacillus albus TaxID=407036 RepID=A0A1G9AMG1_9BACI|nr:hypothetical protein SAMN05216243_2608 [Sediminibacillus albus]